MADSQELTILRLGAQGDGVAETAQGAVFTPFTLAGERVEARVAGETGELLQILAASPHRVKPPCVHFGACGGCKLQHMEASGYLDWKRELVLAAFRSRGLEAAVEPVVPCKGARRRAVLSARQTSAGVLVGYHRAASHELIGIEMCPVLHPSIVASLPALKTLIAPLLTRSGELRLTTTWTNAGLCVAIEASAIKLSPELRARLASAAAQAAIARMSIAGDPVYEALSPTLTLGRAEVVLPPGSFLQAVAEMEEEMARLVLRAAAKSKSIADLFCGLGAFTLRLAEIAKVFAVDSDKPAIAALVAGTRKARGLKPIEARVRDLFREPLSATELRDYDCVVFDPPRAGADAQARMIARAKITTVIAVSCNPATLARDARTLVDAGYAVESITPLDQFAYAPHVEAVAVFRRR